MRKTPDIGADTNPCLLAAGRAHDARAHVARVPESVALTEGGDLLADVLEPLAQAIDAARAASPLGALARQTAPLPVSPSVPRPGMPSPATAQAQSKPPRPVDHGDPFEGNPLQAKTAGETLGRKFWIGSVTVHLAFAVALLLLPERAAQEIEPAPLEIAFYKPEALRPPEPPPAPPPVEAQPKPKPKPKPKQDPAPEPAPVVAAARPSELPPEPLPAPPQVQTDVVARAEPPAAPTPKRTAQLAGFTRAETVAAERVEPARQVARAGSFGEETTEREQPAPRAPSRAVAAGSFANDAMPIPRAEPARERAGVTASGFAASTAEPAAETPPARARAAVTSIGFDTETTTAAAGGSAPRAGNVTRAGFGDGAAAAPAPRQRERPAQVLDTPVEILAKTNPVYTAEAREKRIEGEVVLEVLFDASGELQVLRVIDGLGHGLDEAAVAAAQKIEFTPARRDGRPVDYTATLRVVFRLA